MAGPISEEEEFEFRFRAEQEAAAVQKRKPAAAPQPKEQGFFNKLTTGVSRLPALVGLNKNISPAQAAGTLAKGAAEGLMAAGRGVVGGVGGKTGEDILINAPIAGIGSLVRPELGGFNEQMALSRSQGKRLAKEQPLGALVGNVLGFANVGSAVRNALPAGMSTGTKLMTEGAVLGGASALADRRPEDVFRDVTIGAAVGRVAEPVGELAGKALAAGAQKVGDVVGAVLGRPTTVGPLSSKTVRSIANRTKSSADDIQKAYDEFAKYNPGQAASFAEIADTATINRFADMANMRRAIGDDRMGAIYRDFEDKAALARPGNIQASAEAGGPTAFAPNVRAGLEESADVVKKQAEDFKVSMIDEVEADKAQKLAQIDEVTNAQVAARNEAKVADEDAIKLDRQTKMRDLEKAAAARIASNKDVSVQEIEDIKLSRDAQIAQINKAADAQVSARRNMSVEERDAIRLDKDARIAAINKATDEQIAARRELQLDEADEIRLTKDAQVAQLNKAADEQIAARKEQAFNEAEEIRLAKEAEVAAIKKTADEQVAARKEQAFNAAEDIRLAKEAQVSAIKKTEAEQIAASKGSFAQQADDIKLARDNQIAEINKAADAQIAARRNISVEESDAIKLARDNQIAEVTRAAKAQTDELDVAARIEKQELNSAIEIDTAINDWATETLRLSGLADKTITLKPSVFKSAISKEVVLPVLQKMMNSLPEKSRPPLARAIAAITEGEASVATVNDLDILRRALNSIAEKSPENFALFESAKTLANIIDKQAKGYKSFLDNYSLAKEAATGFAKFNSAFGKTPDIMRFGAQVAEAKQQVIAALGPRGQAIVEAVENSMTKLSKLADEANAVKAAAEAARTSTKAQSVGSLRDVARSTEETILGVKETAETAKAATKASAMAASRAASNALEENVAAIRGSSEEATKAAKEAARSAARTSEKALEENVSVIRGSSEEAAKAAREAARSAARSADKALDDSVSAIRETSEAAKTAAKEAARSSARGSSKAFDDSVSAIRQSAEDAKAIAKAAALSASRESGKSLDDSVAAITEAAENAKAAAKTAARGISIQTKKSLDESIASINESLEAAKDAARAAALAASRQAAKSAEENIAAVKASGAKEKEAVAANAKEAVRQITRMANQEIERITKVLRNNKEAVDAVDKILTETTGRFDAAVSRATANMPLAAIARGSIADAAGESVAGSIRTARALSEGAVGQRLKTVMSPEEAESLVGMGRTQYKAAKNVSALPTERLVDKVIPTPGALALDALGGAAGRPGPGYKVALLKKLAQTVNRFGLRGQKVTDIAEAVVRQDDAAVNQIISGLKRNQENIRQAVDKVRGAIQAGRDITTDEIARVGERQTAIDDLMANGYSFREAQEIVDLTNALDR